ncbi:MAG: hypothetical protein KC583_23055, partial [Myxococcales bacterium]|nr:hypothetical protein [Myxococcales bacterium]
SPSSRVTFLNIPGTPDDADASGCDLVGGNNGTGLAGVLALAGGDLGQFLNPDENGDISLILLAQLAGWDEGQTGNEVGTADLKLFNGDLNADGDFFIDPASFIDNDPMNDPLIFFPGASTENQLLVTPASEFALSLPLVEGLPIQINLAETKLKANLAVGAAGFDLTSGVLSGYLPRQSIVDLIVAIQTACGAENPPSLCDTVTAVLPIDGNPEDVLPLILQLIGGFDARLDAGVPGDCDPLAMEGDANACNAVSVCLEIESEGTKIAGVSAE